MPNQPPDSTSQGRYGRTTKYFVWLFALAVVAFAVNRATVSLFKRAGSSQHSPPSTERILIPEQDLVIPGRWREGDPATHRFRVSNCSAEDIEIAKFLETCDCISIIAEDGLHIPAGEDRWFQMTFRPKPGSVQSRSWNDTIISSRVSMMYTIGGFERSASFNFRATFRRVLSVIPPVLDLGMISQHQKDIERNILVELADDVADCRVLPTPTWAIATIPISTYQGRRRLNMRIKYAGDQKLGSLLSMIELIPLSPSGLSLASRQIRITGEIVRDVCSDPPGIHLGPAKIGPSFEEQIVFKSLTGRDFKILNPRLATPINVAIDRSSDREPRFVIRTLIRELGERKTSLTFPVVENSGLEYDIEVPVFYLGFNSATPSK